MVQYPQHDDTRNCQLLLQDVEKQLPNNQFVRCNSGIIVNLKYVTGILKDSLVVFNEELPIAKSRKKDVLNMLTRYIG